MPETPISVRRWGNTDEAHMRVNKADGEQARRYERELHVCPALPNGVHLSIHIWGIGHDSQSAAGLNLTPEEAINLVEHITRVLSRGDHVAPREKEQS